MHAGHYITVISFETIYDLDAERGRGELLIWNLHGTRGAPGTPYFSKVGEVVDIAG
jgi:hypothetical protein